MITTRPLITDLDQIETLWHQQTAYHVDLDPFSYVLPNQKTTEFNHQYLFKAITTDVPHILVVKENNHLIGLVIFKQEKTTENDSSIVDYGEIIDLHVDTASRGLGIGTQLIKVVEDYFKLVKVNYIRIQVSTFNTNAITLYEKLGYLTRQSIMYKKI